MPQPKSQHVLLLSTTISNTDFSLLQGPSTPFDWSSDEEDSLDNEITVVVGTRRLPADIRAAQDPRFSTLSENEDPWELVTMANSSASSLDLPIRGASPASSMPGSYTNANGAVNGTNYSSPLPAGHQQDLNYLYEQIQELSSLLKINRARTAELTKRAEQAEVRTLHTVKSP